MLKPSIIPILLLLLLGSTPGPGSREITFQWNQEITGELLGWRLWISIDPGGLYEQQGEDILYKGSPLPSYQELVILTSLDGEPDIRYFVATAFNSYGESGYSDEVKAVIRYIPDNQ